MPDLERVTGTTLIVMSMSHEARLLTALEKKVHRIKKLREKVGFRMKAAEEQFIQLKRELDYTFRQLEEVPLDHLVAQYHPNESIH